MYRCTKIYPLTLFGPYSMSLQCSQATRYNNDWSVIHVSVPDRSITEVLCCVYNAINTAFICAINQGHCWSAKWEEKAAGAEENRAWGLAVNKAAFVQRKEAIIFNTLQTDRALLLTRTLSALVMHVAHSLGIWSCCSVERCLLKLLVLQRESNAFSIGNIT